MSWENLVKDQSIIPQVTSKPFFLDYVIIDIFIIIEWWLLQLTNSYNNYLLINNYLYNNYLFKSSKNL